MSAAVLQIGALGAHDVFTQLEPTVTFFKHTYKQHTPFAIEPKDLEFQTTANWGQKATANMQRNADLYAKIWGSWTLGSLENTQGNDPNAHWVNDVGHAMLEEVELDIGSVNFNKYGPEWLHVWEELNCLEEQQMSRFVGGKLNDVTELVAYSASSQKVYVELPFFFTEYWTQALPLVGLHLTEIKIKIKFKTAIECVATTESSLNSSDAALTNPKLVAETVVLDDPERDFFAASRLIYLVHQVQTATESYSSTSSTSTKNIDLQLNHPIKELIWVLRQDAKVAAGAGREYFNFEGQETDSEAFDTAQILFNSNQRLQFMDQKYFRVLQPKMYHKRIPNKHIHVFSFSIDPASINPNGSANFSRIDHVRLVLKFASAVTNATTIIILARSINIAEVFRGIMQLQFAS